MDGTYYSETPAEGYDPAGPNDSQGYITEVGNMNPTIGLLGCYLSGSYEGLLDHALPGRFLCLFPFKGSFGPRGVLATVQELGPEIEDETF